MAVCVRVAGSRHLRQCRDTFSDEGQGKECALQRRAMMQMHKRMQHRRLPIWSVRRRAVLPSSRLALGIQRMEAEVYFAPE